MFFFIRLKNRDDFANFLNMVDSILIETDVIYMCEVCRGRGETLSPAISKLHSRGVLLITIVIVRIDPIGIGDYWNCIILKGFRPYQCL